MLAAEKRAQVAEGIKDAITKTIEEYRGAMDNERAFVSAHLQPGQKMPEIKTLTGSRREAFASRVEGFRMEAMAELQALRDAVDAEVTEPPTDEAIRALRVLKMRDNVSGAEVSAFLRRYGDNYQVRHALEGGDLFDGSEVDELLDRIGQLERSVMSCTDADALLEGRASVGSLSFARSFVCETMGVEPLEGGADEGGADDDGGDDDE